MRFVCSLWRGQGFWKSVAKYDARHPAVLASMLDRHGGHELTCIHDGSFEMPPGVHGIVMPPDVARLPDYLPKLWIWSEDLHNQIGERFGAIDLDVVLAGDLAPLLETSDPLRIWDQAARELYNTSLFVLDPGFGNEVWERLSSDELRRARQAADYWTGDQSWVAYVLGPGYSTFGEADGVIQYRPKHHRAAMPEGMIAGFMCGPYEPFSESEESEWVKEAYR